jgi:uncharacterized protein YdeI (YjbR/CyaY-like superfamily)
MRDWPRVTVAGRAELRDWLAANFARTEPVWLISGKKAAGDAYLPYSDIVEEALCFGWVDSLPRALDATHSMLLLSPRKLGSAWSKPNRHRIERLIAADLMHPAGLAKVTAAKADGSWDFLKATESGDIPEDLAVALAAVPDARRNYDAFSAPVRRRIVEFLLRAKRPDTRTARIGKVVEGAHAGVDPLIWKPKG